MIAGSSSLRWKSIVAATALFMAVAGLAACTTLKPDPALDGVATQTFEDLRLGRFDAVRARMTPEARAVSTNAQLQTIRAYAPANRPLERRAVGWNVFLRVGAPSTAELAYELRYPDQGMLYTLVLKRPKDGATWALQSFHLNKANNADLARNALLSGGKSPLQWAFLAMTVLSPLVMVAALVALLRGPKMKLKWLWAIVAFAGIGTAQMNWGTGQWGFNLLSIQLVGFGLSKQGFLGFYPWMLKFTPPVGALVVLWRVRRARLKASGSTADAIAETLA